MKTRKLSFKLIYLIFVLLLAALVCAAVLYVRSLLKEYEASQPDLLARTAADQLAERAAAGDFWSEYNLPEVTPGPFEKNRNVKAEYLACYTDENLTVTQTASTEDTLIYTVKQNSQPLAEIKLKADGPAVTKLAVLSIREWVVESVTPLFTAQDYTLTVPNAFSVQVNGMPLTAADGTPSGTRQIEYTVSDLYLEPDFLITDADGNKADYTLKNGRVLVEFYDYSLTLPSILAVEVNGTKAQGESAGNGLTRYDIVTLSQPDVLVRDDYGNTVRYEGGSQFPLTYTSITADTRCTVRVNGAAVPEHRIVTHIDPEYTQLADFVSNLPTVCDYTIAVLQENAAISVTDAAGSSISLDTSISPHDLTDHVVRLDVVPAEVAAQVDVLRIAQNWSMFLTDDLPFDQLKDSLIAGSYQYTVAWKYATGIDIKYTSKHTLADPAFTENKVTNFTWITDDCFSVDISFVKHMRLYYGAMVDDPMNDRFYFVRYDDTDNGLDDPMWKLASMKEVV